MKKLLLISLIIMGSAFGLCAKAQVVDTAHFAKIIKEQQIKELHNKGYKDVEVNVLNIPVQRVEINDGNISIKINSNSELCGREYKKIDIYVNSNYQRSIGVPVEIKVFENIIVAKDTIMKDTQLSTSNVEFKRCDIANMIQTPVTEKELQSELIATKMYKPGEIIDKRFSKSKPDIVRNAFVTVVFKTENDVSISVDGKALTEGSIGSFISVENKTYKKVYLGKIIGPNKVLVEI